MIPRVIRPRVIIMLVLSSLVASEVVVMTTHCVTSDNKVGITSILGHHFGLRKHENWYHDDSGPSSWSGEARKLIPLRFWAIILVWGGMKIVSSRFWTIILVWVGVSHASTNQERWWSRITMIPTSMMSISIPIMSMHSHLIYSQVPL